MTGVADQPGYESPYGAPPALPYPYGSRLKAPSGLAVATITLAVVVTVLQVSMTAAMWTTEGVDDDRLPVLAVFSLLGLLSIVALLAAWIVTSLWLHTCRSNVDQVGPPMRHARSPVWAWLGWWVPIVNLWFPYQFVRDVQDAGRRNRPTSPLGLWWTGWVVYLIFSGADESVVAATIASVGALVALVPWIQVVRGVSEDQRALVRAR